MPMIINAKVDGNEIRATFAEIICGVTRTSENDDVPVDCVAPNEVS